MSTATNVSSVWPKARELQYHLQWKPWLTLPRTFQSQRALQEAIDLLSQFVSHRPESQGGTGQWKGLALRSKGGQLHHTYGSENYEGLNYEFTEVWEKCVATREVLELFTDPQQCERIRFMLLEPGAEILVHNDAPEKFFSPAINIALNMPDGCKFWVDLNPDGSKNSYSQAMPIEGGTAFLFNSANFHSVKNESDQPRIHIIAHGPLKFSQEELIHLARRQNQLEGAHSVFSAVCKKRTALGFHQFSPEQEADLFHLGVRPDSLPDFASLAVLQPKLEDPLLVEEATHITQGSLHPLLCEKVPQRFLENWLEQELRRGKEFAVVVGAGTFFRSSHRFWMELMQCLHRLTKEELPLAAQILLKDGLAPHIHEQFFILHLPSWEKSGRPAFQNSGNIAFPSFERSPENIHSNYTPLWIRPASGESGGAVNATQFSSSLFGSEVLASFLGHGKTVTNIPLEIRNGKEYGYPKDGRGSAWWLLKKTVGQFQKLSEERVYPFNTERLLVRNYGLQPEILLAPCAGLKPIAIFRQLQGMKNNLQMVLVEKNPLSLEFYQNLLDADSEEQWLAVLEREVRKDFTSDSEAKEYAKKMFEADLMEGFSSSILNFQQTVRSIRGNVQFIQMDYLESHKAIVSLLKKKKFFFWHSNAWQTNAAICVNGELALRSNYRQLLLAVMREYELSCFTHKSAFEAIFGDFQTPTGVFTMGGKKQEPPKRGAFEFFPLEKTSLSLAETRKNLEEVVVLDPTLGKQDRSADLTETTVR